MILGEDSLKILADAVRKLQEGFAGLPAYPTSPESREALEEVLLATAERLQDNYPYFHPLYAGQMLKPPHPAARLAYSLAMLVNPNNHALDGGRATSLMEKEAVAQIAAMFGWNKFLGHLCGGGTMANLEALWIAGRLHPGKKIFAGEQAHYTHKRITSVLQLPFEMLPCDDRGRLRVDALEARLDQGDIGTVVVTLGTTATGSVDPLHHVLRLRETYGFRIHVDAAYGGYFVLARNLAPEAKQSFARIGEADSIVVDPHKHGLQPYGCGCVLFRDPGVGVLYKHESPYTYFSSAELHLGEISLECSRPGAAAAALWATQKLLPLFAGGDFARGLERGKEAALLLNRKLEDDGHFVPAFEPELDILVFAPRAATLAEASQHSRRVFEAAARRGLHLALAELPARFWKGRGLALVEDQPSVTCLRSVLMKPDHFDWLDAIWERLHLAYLDTRPAR